MLRLYSLLENLNIECNTSANEAQLRRACLPAPTLRQAQDGAGSASVLCEARSWIEKGEEQYNVLPLFFIFGWHLFAKIGL